MDLVKLIKECQNNIELAIDFIKVVNMDCDFITKMIGNIRIHNLSTISRILNQVIWINNIDETTKWYKVNKIVTRANLVISKLSMPSHTKTER